MSGMRGGEFYYVRTLEKVQIALLDMFNDLRVNKYKGINRKEIDRSIKIPLVTMYNKDFANWYTNNQKKHRLMPLPIAGLRLKGPPTRNVQGATQSTYARALFSKATDQWIRDIQPTPHFIDYTLHFLCDNLSDYGQIVENVLPYFNPARYLRLREWDFAADEFERKIQVHLIGSNVEFQDEIENGPKHRYIKFNIDFRLEVELYRPFEMAEMIKYAELNIATDGIVGKHQAIIYPTDIMEVASGGVKPYETVTDSSIPGYSILGTICRTLVKQNEVNGVITYEDVTSPGGLRPAEVPDIKQLDLWFDQDSDLAEDNSPYHRDFTVLNGGSRGYLPGFTPGAGQIVSDGGYEVDPALHWNQILSWFGKNNGLNLTPFTFHVKLQFNENSVKDSVFQQLENKETTEYPAGSVSFEWGLMDGHLYFSFTTYKLLPTPGPALSYTFKSSRQLELDNLAVYDFVFALYDEGRSGIFAFSMNNSPHIVLETERL